MVKLKMTGNLQIEHRIQIQTMLDNNHKAKEIALYVGCHISTIYREVKRVLGFSSYDAQGSQTAISTNMVRDNKRSPSDDLVKLIDSKLTDDQWSPNQISKWLKLHGREEISHTWIYEHIERDRLAGGKLHTNLRSGKYVPKNHDYKGKIPDRVTIDDRPEIIDERSRLGDYEIDLIVGTKNKGAILSMIDRSSRFCILKKLSGKTAAEVEESLVNALLPYKDMLLTITSDNGNEFINHKSIAERLEIEYYFAHPYASYERGSIENLNGLVRQYIPKGTDFATVEEKTVKMAQDKLNNRPKAVLGYYTPNEYLENMKKAA
jgi:IS30 family transposase